MQKIREIVKQIGGSDELADQLIAAVQEHVESERVTVQEEYKAKIQKAKQVCLEEVAAEKARIARKVEVFIESKVASIERAAGKTRAIEESAAVAQLRQIQKILGGEGGNSAELEALNRKLARIAEQTASIKEERDVAVRKANQANMIAAKTLRRLRTFEEQAAKPGKTVTEDDAAATATATETAEATTAATTTTTAEAPVTTTEKPTEEIQAIRVESEVPVTTQASQADLPAQIKPEELVASAAVLSPDQIAAQMGEEPQV
jgi:hypothetical protein